jgi:hypothetical protein
VFERKIHRENFGPTKEENSNWRIKTKILDQLKKRIVNGELKQKFWTN